MKIWRNVQYYHFQRPVIIVVLAQESATIHSFMSPTISDAILGNINMLELKQRSRKGKMR